MLAAAISQVGLLVDQKREHSNQETNENLPTDTSKPRSAIPKAATLSEEEQFDLFLKGEIDSLNREKELVPRSQEEFKGTEIAGGGGASSTVKEYQRIFYEYEQTKLSSDQIVLHNGRKAIEI